jgi:membrane protease subunit (stomatin/prohibitin family)
MNIASIIKYEGDNSTFVWKHPSEDFNATTQLIVHESQEVLFYMNGEALDLFGPGRHTLVTQNIPLIRKYFSRATGDETPFHCEVYFINKTEQMGIKWGTDSKVEYIEPTYKFPVQIGACGEMNLRVKEARKLLVKVVGTECGLTQQALAQKFRAFLMTRLKTYLATLIREKEINIFQIDEKLTEMSESIHAKLAPDFADYGLSLERFFVMTIVKPEDDVNYQRFKTIHFRQYADVAEANIRQRVGVIDQQTKAQRMVIEAMGLAQKRSTEGYTYRDERGFDVAERVAANEASGQFANLGIGMGLISGLGSSVSGTVGGMVQNSLGNVLPGQPPAQTTPTPPVSPDSPLGTPGAPDVKCPKCARQLPPSAKFCLECGVNLAVDEVVVCQKCGNPTPKAKFCLSCGAAQ